MNDVYIQLPTEVEFCRFGRHKTRRLFVFTSNRFAVSMSLSEGNESKETIVWPIQCIGRMNLGNKDSVKQICRYLKAFYVATTILLNVFHSKLALDSQFDAIRCEMSKSYTQKFDANEIQLMMQLSNLEWNKYFQWDQNAWQNAYNPRTNDTNYASINKQQLFLRHGNKQPLILTYLLNNFYHYFIAKFTRFHHRIQYIQLLLF